MALVALVIIAALLAAVLIFGNVVPRTKDAEAFARNDPRFTAIHAALQQFALVNMRLPCPANGLATSGLEDPVGASVTCNSPSGVVPWTSIGLPQSSVIDSWGRLISYRVFDGGTGFTRANGLQLADCQDVDLTPTIALTGPGGTCDTTPRTHVNTRSDFLATKGIDLRDHANPAIKVAYVLISFGPTGLGGYAPNSSAPLPAPTAAAELANAGSAGTYWILDPSSGLAAEDPNFFDDVVSYSLPSTFVSAAGIGGRWWPTAVAPSPGVVNSTQFVTQSFRTPRRVLKLALTSFKTSDQATVTFTKVDTSLATVTFSGCSMTAGTYPFTLNPGYEFTDVKVGYVSSNFSVDELVACRYDDPTACTFSVAFTPC